MLYVYSNLLKGAIAARGSDKEFSWIELKKFYKKKLCKVEVKCEFSGIWEIIFSQEDTVLDHIMVSIEENRWGIPIGKFSFIEGRAFSKSIIINILKYCLGKKFPASYEESDCFYKIFKKHLNFKYSNQNSKDFQVFYIYF